MPDSISRPASPQATTAVQAQASFSRRRSSRKASNVFLLRFLLSLSTVPSVVGSLHALYRIVSEFSSLSSSSSRSKNVLSPWCPWSVHPGPVYPAYPTTLEWVLSIAWAVAMGWWLHALAAGLLRRWLAYYGLYSAMLRLLSLQAICWPLCHSVVRRYPGNPDHPLLGWTVASILSAFANSIRHWVTSNLYPHKRPSSFRPSPSSNNLLLGLGNTPNNHNNDNNSNSTNHPTTATSHTNHNPHNSSSRNYYNTITNLLTTLKESIFASKTGRGISIPELVQTTIIPLACLAIISLPLVLFQQSNDDAVVMEMHGSRSTYLSFSDASTQPPPQPPTNVWSNVLFFILSTNSSESTHRRTFYREHLNAKNIPYRFIMSSTTPFVNEEEETNHHGDLLIHDNDSSNKNYADDCFDRFVFRSIRSVTNSGDMEWGWKWLLISRDDVFMDDSAWGGLISAVNASNHDSLNDGWRGVVPLQQDGVEEHHHHQYPFARTDIRFSLIHRKYLKESMSNYPCPGPIPTHTSIFLHPLAKPTYSFTLSQFNGQSTPRSPTTTTITTTTVGELLRMGFGYVVSALS